VVKVFIFSHPFDPKIKNYELNGSTGSEKVLHCKKFQLGVKGVSFTKSFFQLIFFKSKKF